jgi:beta-galactosidase
VDQRRQRERWHTCEVPSASAALLSFDDNEVTSWASDGQLNHAWINYELERPATIGEVTLKLGSWRTRSYPIRISIDDQIVFNGATAPSLGYVTIDFQPATGRHLKLELTGTPRDVDSLGNIVGVTGANDVDTKNRANVSFTVVEVEIYEPAKTVWKDR